MKILGVDPGGRTGLALYDMVRSKWSFPFGGVLGPEEHHYELYDLCIEQAPMYVVCERFDHRPNQRAGVSLISREYIGVLKLAIVSGAYAASNGEGLLVNPELVQQQQLKGHKGLWTNDKLKALDLYVTGSTNNHRNDAVRQVMYFVTVTLKDLRFINEYGRTQGIEV